MEKSTNLLEARGGIEPPNKGFADLCLTTWLPRRNQEGLDCCHSPHHTALSLLKSMPPHPGHRMQGGCKLIR